MSNITSIPRKVDENSRQVSSFLAPKNSHKKIFESLKDDLESAIEQPDTRHPGQRAEPAALAPVQAPGEGVQARSEPAPLAPVVSAPAPLAEPEPEAMVKEQLPVKAKPARPRMAEKSFSIEADQYKLIVRYSNMEGLRLETNVSSSEIVRRLLDFALAHVDPAKGDVLNLEVPARGVTK